MGQGKEPQGVQDDLRPQHLDPQEFPRDLHHRRLANAREQGAAGQVAQPPAFRGKDFVQVGDLPHLGLDDIREAQAPPFNDQ
jgi:hypothetical protein